MQERTSARPRAENTVSVTFWRRRKPTWPPPGTGFEHSGAGDFREVAEPEPGEDGGAGETGGEDLWDHDEFTQVEGSDPGNFDGEPLEPPPELRLAGSREPHVVSTLLSKKPGRDAALAVAWTLGILLVVSGFYWWGPPDLAAALPASGEAVFERGEVWRLATALAAHADPIHLLSNAVFLTWLIYLAYGAFGASLYPWSTVPLSAIALAVTLEGYPGNIRVVGASGMLYLLAGAWLTLYVLVERRLSVPKRLLRVIGFFLVVLDSSGGELPGPLHRSLLRDLPGARLLPGPPRHDPAGRTVGVGGGLRLRYDDRVRGVTAAARSDTLV